MPDDSELSEEDLLKQALELADLEETKRHRQIFHRWRRDVILSGKAQGEVLEEMEEAIQQYRSAVGKSKIVTGAKYAFAVVTAGLGAAAVAVPPLAAAGAFTGLGSFVVSESVHRKIPEKLKVAAMFYDARKRFGWYRRKRTRR